MEVGEWEEGHPHRGKEEGVKGEWDRGICGGVTKKEDII